jgi:hypothetical protein
MNEALNRAAAAAAAAAESQARVTAVYPITTGDCEHEHGELPHMESYRIVPLALMRPCCSHGCSIASGQRCIAALHCIELTCACPWC